jgi:hypothetical protein
MLLEDQIFETLMSLKLLADIKWKDLTAKFGNPPPKKKPSNVLTLKG